MFIEYLPRQTYLHSLDVRSKIIGFAGFSLLLFMFANPLYNLVLASFVGILAYSARLPIKKIGRLLAPLIPVYILIMVFSSFTRPDSFLSPLNQTVLFYLLPQQKIGMTIGGILTGCTLLIRLLNMIIASSLVTLTTPIDDFIQLFNKLKFPYEFSFVVTTALRFIPTMDRKRLLIIDAQKSRGAKLDDKGIVGQIKGAIPIMVPMMVNSIMMANNLSKAMLNRGYGCSVHRTALRQISFKKRDYAACLLVLMIVISGIYLRFALHSGSL